MDTALRRPHHRGPAWLGPLLPPLTLCRKVPGAPFPGCHAEHPGHSRGSRAPQQHTLFPAREARQPLARGLPTGPSLEPDTGASLGQRREDRDHRGRLALSRGPHASQVCRPPGTCSARGRRCPSTATSSADGGCHPGASPAAREWTQLLDEALTLRDESARWNRVLPRADSCLWKLRQPSSLASWNARKEVAKARSARQILSWELLGDSEGTPGLHPSPGSHCGHFPGGLAPSAGHLFPGPRRPGRTCTASALKPVACDALNHRASCRQTCSCGARESPRGHVSRVGDGTAQAGGPER